MDIDVIDVFEHLINLTVLTLDKDKSDVLSTVVFRRILLSGCSLRHFQTGYASRLYCKFMQASRHTLEFLSIEDDLCSSFADMAPEPLDLPLVHTVVLRHVLYNDRIIMWLIKCKLPSLKSLIISGMIGRSPLRSWFQTFGCAATSLDLGDLSWRSTATYLESLIHFPLLQELTIHKEFLLRMPGSSRTLLYPKCPNLTRINLRTEFHQRHYSLINLMDTWARCMSVIEDSFIASPSPEAPPIAPNLKCIRLADIGPTKFERTPFPRRHIDQWKCWISGFRDAGVMFEFFTGDLVAIPVDFLHLDDVGWYLPEEGLARLVDG
jgi:hypothetical protein